MIETRCHVCNAFYATSERLVLIGRIYFVSLLKKELVIRKEKILINKQAGNIQTRQLKIANGIPPLLYAMVVSNCVLLAPGSN